MRITLFIATLALPGQGSTKTGTPVPQTLPRQYAIRSTIHGLASDFLYDVSVSGSKVYVGTDKGLSLSTDGGNSFTTRTMANGLPSNYVYSVAAAGSSLYAATSQGLSISRDNGTHWQTWAKPPELGTASVYAVTASGSNVYAATFSGLAVSTDSGNTFSVRTKEANGLSSNVVFGTVVMGSVVYAATDYGLSISTDGGNRFTTRLLPFDIVQGVSVSGLNIYAATRSGVAISTDGGNHFQYRSTTQGLGSDNVNRVFVSGKSVYAATANGLSVSTNGGASFSNRTRGTGQYNDDFVSAIHGESDLVYAATRGGLIISVQPQAHTCNVLDTALACFILKRGGPEQLIDAGRSLTFVSIEDRRCPAGVDCVWAGSVKANFILKSVDGSVPARNISLTLDPRNARSAYWIDGMTRFTIQLLEVSSDTSGDYAKLAVGLTDLPSDEFKYDTDYPILWR